MNEGEYARRGQGDEKRLPAILWCCRTLLPSSALVPPSLHPRASVVHFLASCLPVREGVNPRERQRPHRFYRESSVQIAIAVGAKEISEENRVLGGFERDFFCRIMIAGG